MQHTHQVVRIKIQILDNGDGSHYIATNDELGVITKSTSFKQLLDDLREALAVSATQRTLSLQFYSDTTNSNPSTLH